MRNEAKRLPAPITGIRNHKHKQNPKHPSQPRRQKAESPSVETWSAVTLGPESQKQQTKTPLRQVFINKHAPIPFTREQWQPRYLPSFCQTVTSPRHPARARSIARACHHEDFSLRKPNLFPRTNTKSHFNPYSSAIKTPSSMLPNIDIL